MSATETTDTSSLSAKLLALRDTLTERVDGVADSGKALITNRRDDRRRDELLKELGALHVAAATGGDLDLQHADRLVAEIAAIGAADETASTESESDDVES